MEAAVLDSRPDHRGEAVGVAVLAVVVATGLAGYHLRPGTQPAAAPVATTSPPPATTTTSAPRESAISVLPPPETVTVTRETVTREVAAPIVRLPAARLHLRYTRLHDDWSGHTVSPSRSEFQNSRRKISTPCRCGCAVSA